MTMYRYSSGGRRIKIVWGALRRDLGQGVDIKSGKEEMEEV